MNFSLGLYEVLRFSSLEDNLSALFLVKLEEVGIVDIDPINMKMTWTNKRSGSTKIEKILDRFLVNEAMLEKQFQLR